MRRKGEKKKVSRLLFRGFSWPSALAEGRFQAQGGGDHRLPVCGPEGLLPIHTGAQRGEFMIEERLIDPLEPVGGGLDGSGVVQMRESQTRPGPVHRVFDRPRANRIAEHVAEDREEMRVLLNRKTFETALPHMPVTVVVPMVAADMAGHPLRHEWAEGCLGGRLHDEVKMIGHEADAEELDEVGGFRGGEPVETGGIVAVPFSSPCLRSSQEILPLRIILYVYCSQCLTASSDARRSATGFARFHRHRGSS